MPKAAADSYPSLSAKALIGRRIAIPSTPCQLEPSDPSAERHSCLTLNMATQTLVAHHDDLCSIGRAQRNPSSPRANGIDPRQIDLSKKEARPCRVCSPVSGVFEHDVGDPFQLRIRRQLPYRGNPLSPRSIPQSASRQRGNVESPPRSHLQDREDEPKEKSGDQSSRLLSMKWASG